MPADVLKRFDVDERGDTRFSSCARLLQSIWRERRNIAIGSLKHPGRKSRKLGSRVAPAIARTGIGFLAPDIARITRHEVAYREIGALIEERRLWENLLSSQGLTLNLFARARADRDYATRLFSTLFPDLIAEVTDFALEHSPGRGDPRYLGDYTAFDLFVAGLGPDGKPTFAAIEVKYSETMRQPGRGANPRYRELTRAYALHLDPESPGLFAEPLAQLTAEHLLAAVIRDQFGEGARGAFATIAPAGNRDAWNAIELYRMSLADEPDHVAFVPLTLEAVIHAVRSIGDAELADALHERYTDFSPIHALIDDWQPFAEA
ncbi:hypothetical protein ACFQ4O_01880 [Methylopila musalis]|uniref:PD-(D/E)XK nuclease-like domain-containing protein n=1 Tax=Methylopila musalis TaxID=1134781 RepID=A0ABW3Z3E5_9HYPH